MYQCFPNIKCFLFLFFLATFCTGISAFSQEKMDTSAFHKNTMEVLKKVNITDSLHQHTSRDTSKKASLAQVFLSPKLDPIKDLAKFDSSDRKRLLKKVIPTTNGNISAGYDYGIIPFAAKTGFPLGYYNSQGNIGISALGLPLNITYYYSSLKNIAGLNNYFRVAFDPMRYKENLQQNAFKKIESEKQKLSQLLNVKQELQQKLSYNEHMFANISAPELLSSQLQNYKFKYDAGQYSLDSLQKLNLNGNDSVRSLQNKKYKFKLSSYADSIISITSKIKGYDSVTKKITAYKQQIETVQKQINSINNKLEYLQNPQQILQSDNPYLKKGQAFLSGLKALDVGLCYPNYSTFLVNGSTLKGINVEWEKKLYFAFTYGKTINTVLTTNNIIQNQLQTGRNFYNFFDLNNVKDSRKIVALKVGVGKKDGTHIYGGFLYGLGLPSYLSTSNPGSVEKNIAVEVDGKITINSANSLDIIVGKSALYQNDVPENPDNTVSQSVFSKFRSFASLVRYNSFIRRTKTKITVMGRLVDPFFKSYGIGFMRSDNLRYELKIEQEISSKIKLTAFYRKDRDNLLNTSLYTTNLQSMGINLSIKVNKRFILKAVYSPVLLNIGSRDSSNVKKQNLNNISNVVLTYTPRFVKISSFFNAMFSYYQFMNVAGKSNNFQSYNVTNTTVFNASVKSNIAANYFLNTAGDSLNGNTLMTSGSVSYTGKNGACYTLGIKYADNKLVQNQIGGILKINIPIVKYIHAEFYAEKLVLGDFYNSYNLTEIRKFPYYGYGKIIVSW